MSCKPRHLDESLKNDHLPLDEKYTDDVPFKRNSTNHHKFIWYLYTAAWKIKSIFLRQEMWCSALLPLSNTAQIMVTGARGRRDAASLMYIEAY